MQKRFYLITWAVDELQLSFRQIEAYAIPQVLGAGEASFEVTWHPIIARYLIY
jgi:hypothetical protein